MLSRQKRKKKFALKAEREKNERKHGKISMC